MQSFQSNEFFITNYDVLFLFSFFSGNSCLMTGVGELKSENALLSKNSWTSEENLWYNYFQGFLPSLL